MGGLLRIFIPKQHPGHLIMHVRMLLLKICRTFSHARSFISPDDDYAVSVFAALLNKTSDAEFFLARSRSAPFSIFNNETGFMEARNANGSWAGQDAGWTEGDMWAYSFDVVQDLDELVKRRGGNASFVKSLDEHFDGGWFCFSCFIILPLMIFRVGHNDHTNEPSHHIPYLYSLAGAATKTQERVREVAAINYNASVNGLSGVSCAFIKFSNLTEQCLI